MLKGQTKQTAARAAEWSLLLFSIGGSTLATRTDEVGGIRPWADPMPVPSATPYVNALVRYDEEVFPVFDLAAQMQREVQGTPPLCLIAKRHDGPMAVCIDGRIPQLALVEAARVEPSTERDSSVAGHCRIEGARVPIYSFAHLGYPARTSA